MTIEIRKVKAKEMGQAIALADETFRDESHISMGEAYPHIFSNGATHSFGAFDGDKIVGFIGLVPNVIHVGNALLNVFSIGAVCTDVAYRGQGISTKILRDVYAYIDQAGASILIVSGDRGMYRRNHCHYFGEVDRFTMTQQNDLTTTYDGQIRESKGTDLFQLDKLRKESNVYFESSLLTWSTLIEAKGFASNLKMDQGIYVAEHNGKIEAYVVIAIPNKNSKTDKAIVTEWAGDVEVIHSIISSLFSKINVKEIECNVPWSDTLQEVLVPYPVKKQEKDNTLYLVDPARLLDQIKPYLLKKNPDLTNRLEISKVSDDSYKVSTGKATTEINAEQLITLLFSYDPTLQTDELATVFPVPLPYMDGTFYV